MTQQPYFQELILHTSPHTYEIKYITKLWSIAHPAVRVIFLKHKPDRSTLAFVMFHVSQHSRPGPPLGLHMRCSPQMFAGLNVSLLLGL